MPPVSIARPSPYRAQERTAMRIVGPVLIIVAAFVAATVLYGILVGAGLDEDSAAAIAQTVGGLTVLGLGLRSYSGLPRHERRMVLAPKRSLGACVLAGIGLAFVLRIVAGIILSIGQALDPSLCRELLTLDDAIPTVMWQKLLLALSLVVLAPLGEELVFRGLFLRGLVRRLSFPVSAVISGVAFALLHPQYWTIWPLIIAISIFGVVAAYVYRRLGYPANVAMHVVFNLVTAIFLFGDFGIDQSDASCD
jgi:membrane protease YdiL (CAAX protease family)